MDTKYFDRLVGVASTILKSASKNKSFPIGLGPYRLAEQSPSRLTLNSIKGRVTGSFDRIEFLKWEALSPPRDLDDANHIYPRPSNITFTKGLQKIQTPVIKSYALVVNLPSFEMRKAFASCIDQTALQKTMRPDLLPTMGFLPEGVMGSQVSYQEIKTGFGSCNGSLPKDIQFYVLLKSDVDSAKQVLREVGPEFSTKISVLSVPSNELARLIFDRTPKVIMLGFDSSGSMDSNSRESSVFFESFVRNERIIDKAPEGLREAIAKATAATAESDKAALYTVAHKLLLESAYLIPLGQANNLQFYPSRVRHIVWADRLSGFPNIAHMVEAAQ